MWTRPAPSEEPTGDPAEPPEEAPSIQPDPGRGGEPGIDYPGVERGAPDAEPGVEPADPDPS
jgi:hypothetical protein